MRIFAFLSLLFVPILGAEAPDVSQVDPLDLSLVLEEGGDQEDRRLSHHNRPTIEGWVANRGSFSTLVSLLANENIGLAPDGPLNGDGSFTLFAPTNKAFEDTFALYPGLDTFLTTSDAGFEALNTVLTYHVLAARVLSKNIPRRGVIAETLNGESLVAFKHCYWWWGWQYCDVYLQDGTPFLAKVTHPDNLASNGVVHAINKVLVPPSLAGAVAGFRADDSHH